MQPCACVPMMNVGYKEYMPGLDAMKETLCFGWMDNMNSKMTRVDLCAVLCLGSPKSHWTEAFCLRAYCSVGGICIGGSSAEPKDEPYPLKDSLKSRARRSGVAKDDRCSTASPASCLLDPAINCEAKELC